MQQIEHMEQIELIKPSQLMELIKQVELDKDRKVWANKANGESKTEYTIYIQLLKHKEQEKVLELIERVELTPQIE